MTKKLSFLLCAIMVLSLTACGQKADVIPETTDTETEGSESQTEEKTEAAEEAGPADETDDSEEAFVMIPNPFIDCSTLEEAAKLAGFDIAVPGKFDGYPNKMIQAIEKTLIQVMYFDGDPDAEDSSMIMVRKGVGDEDISGDYNEYSEKETVNMHGVDVQLRGDKELVYSAIWTKDGYSFAINADKGLTRDALADAIEEMVTVVG